MTRVLVTGFEPFGGATVNPSQLLVEELAADGIATAVLPVSYASAAGAVREALLAARPEVVVSFGQADRGGISVERFALNLDGSDSVDNDGAVSAAEIDPGGPAAYRSTLPVDELVDALHSEGIPATASRDAGGFLCNHVFYTLMASLPPGAVGGFVHVPMLPEQTLAKDAPSMPLDVVVRAGRVIVDACVRLRSSG